MNDNTKITTGNDELLTWAVQNITEWDDDYTHLRSDCSVNPFYTKECARSSWMAEYGRWGTSALVTTGLFHELEAEFSTKTPQVITKHEWQDAKLREAFNTVLETRHSISKVDNTAQDGFQSQEEAQHGHIHAKVMAEYAEVAKTNPEPWKEFEKGILDDNGKLEWVSMTLLDAFESWHKYRRKPSPPKTMTIGGIVVEAWPLESLNGISGDYIYTIESGVEHQVIAIPTKEIYTGPRYLAGKYFSTKEQAQAVADALNKLYNDALVGWKQQ